MNFICNIQKQSSTGDLSKSTIVYKRRPYIYTRYRPRSCEGSIRSMPSARIRFYFLGIPRYLIRSCYKGALRLSQYSTIEYSTIQYNTIQYITTLYNSVFQTVVRRPLGVREALRGK